MNSFKKNYLQLPFILCVITLSAAVIGMPVLIERLGVHFIKLPLPLKEPLDDINKEALGPYKVVHEMKIHNEEIEEALGTTDYIQWELEDTREPVDSSTRYCSLFITYYTGKPDQVPHVPEECYTGGGNQRMGTEDLEIKFGNKEIPVRSLRFGSESGAAWSNVNFNVFYFFKVNGHYAGNRDSCRGYLQANLFSRYSYFSKVEWKFYNRSPMNTQVFPSQSEAVKASEKLLPVLVPLLEKDHWPDWDKANKENKD